MYAQTQHTHTIIKYMVYRYKGVLLLRISNWTYRHWLPFARHFMELSPAIIIAPSINQKYLFLLLYYIVLIQTLIYILEEKIEVH